MSLATRTTTMLRQQKALHRGASFLVAASAGLDSSVLAHVMGDIARRWQASITLAYIHHGLRPDADAEAEFVRKLCSHLGASFLTERIDVHAGMDASGRSLQDAARTLRYEALERLRASCGAEWILTAHHADDQAETLLMRFLRGAGPAGLAGVRARNGRVLRPFLDVTRAEITAHAREHGIEWMEDVSNDSDAYLRNAVRHHVMPAVAAHCNPSVAGTLARSARLFADLEEYAEAECTRLAEECATVSGEAVYLAVLPFRRYFSFQKFLLIRHLVQKHFGSETHASDADAVARLIETQPGAQATLTGGVHAVRTHDRILLERRHQRPSFCVSLSPGDSVLLPNGLRFRSQRVTAGDMHFTTDRGTEYIDADVAAGPWVLRTRRPGDRMVPFGRTGHVKLGDLFTDAHIPVPERDDVPILECPSGIIWACGVRLDERFRITAGTRHAMRLEIESTMNEEMTDPTHIHDSVTVNGKTFVPYIPPARIQERVLEVAERINAEYEGRNPVFICVLNGAFLFFADLVRHVTIDCATDFIRTASYGDGMESSGRVTLVKDIECDIRGRHVVIVEDIVDTGHSLAFLKEHLLRHEPASIAVAALLHKPEKAVVKHDVRYIGFEIPPDFVVGYGLDYGQLARNLPGIYILAGANGDGSSKENS